MANYLHHQKFSKRPTDQHLLQKNNNRTQSFSPVSHISHQLLSSWKCSSIHSSRLFLFINFTCFFSTSNIFLFFLILYITSFPISLSSTLFRIHSRGISLSEGFVTSVSSSVHATQRHLVVVIVNYLQWMNIESNRIPVVISHHSPAHHLLNNKDDQLSKFNHVFSETFCSKCGFIKQRVSHFWNF